jgi:hypothetical protein
MKTKTRETTPKRIKSVALRVRMRERRAKQNSRVMGAVLSVGGLGIYRDSVC